MFVVKKLLLRKTGGLITNFGVIRPWSYEPDFTVQINIIRFSKYKIRYSSVFVFWLLFL